MSEAGEGCARAWVPGARASYVCQISAPRGHASASSCRRRDQAAHPGSSGGSAPRAMPTRAAQYHEPRQYCSASGTPPLWRRRASRGTGNSFAAIARVCCVCSTFARVLSDLGLRVRDGTMHEDFLIERCLALRHFGRDDGTMPTAPGSLGRLGKKDVAAVRLAAAERGQGARVLPR